MKKKILLALVAIMLMVGILSAFAIVASAETAAPDMSIAYCNISFRDNVCIKYAVNANVSNVKILVWTSPKSEYIIGTHDDEITKYYTEDIDGVSHMIFDYTKLAAKQMTDVIYARAYANVDGADLYSEVNKYSILQYAYNKLGKTAAASADVEFKEMLSNMLLYGASAQKYFDYKEDRLATADWYQVKLTSGVLDDWCRQGLYIAGDKVTLTAPETDAKGHEFSRWVDSNGNEIAVSATYELTVGTVNEVCTPIYDHTVVIDAAVAPSCKDTGLTEGSHCSVCGEVIVAQTVIDVVDHDIVDEICRYCGIGSDFLKLKEDIAALKQKCQTHSTYMTQFSTLISNHPSNCEYSSCTTTINEYNFICWNVARFKNQIDTLETKICELENAEKIAAEKVSELKAEIDEIINGHEYFGGLHIDADIAALNSKIKYLSRAHIANVEIPEGVNYIFSEEFKGYHTITSITIPDSVTSIGHEAFADCSSLTSIIFTGTVSRWNAISKEISWNYNTGEYIVYCTDGEISKNCTVTCYHTFMSIAAIDAPTATENGSRTYTCPSCDYTYTEEIIPTDFTVTSNNRDKVGYTGVTGQNLVIPAVFEDDGTWYRVKIIDNGAFYNCSTIASVTIPDSVTSIGNYAFYYCDAMISVTMGNSVKSIGDDAFGACKVLVSITIPNSVTSIGEEAFYSCYKLKSITFAENNKLSSIGENAFENCSSLENVNVMDIEAWLNISFGSGYAAHPNYYGTLRFLDTNGNETTNIVIPDSVTDIGPYAFHNCTNLTTINIPDSVTSIAFEAFSNCTSLQTVNIGNNVSGIGDLAFYNCNKLTSVIIPGSVTRIGRHVFLQCSSLRSIRFIDMTTWYIDPYYNYSDGTKVAVSNSYTNATYFTSTYASYLWYKL